MRWSKGRAVGVLVAVAALGAATACTDDDAGGNADADTEAVSGAEETDPALAITPDEVASLTEAWRVDGQLGVTGKPAVRDGTVYFGTWAGKATAVDLATGEIVWQTLVASSESVTLDAAPLVTDDRVYLPDGDGLLHAVDRRTGEKAWTVTLESHPDVRIFSTPVLAPMDDGPGVIVIGVASQELRRDLDDFTFKGTIIGIDEESGDERWRAPVAGEADGAGISVWSSATVDEQRGLAFIGTGQAYEHPASPLSDSILALDYATGDLAWSRQFTEGDVWTYFSDPPKGPDADVGATPTLFTVGDQDVVGVGDKAGSFVAFDRETGETVWAKKLTEGSPLGGVMTTAAYAPPDPDREVGEDGIVYVTSNLISPTAMGASNSTDHRSTLFALDAADGATLWEQTLVGATFGSITWADGVVYRPSVPGPLQAFDGETGAMLWETEAGGDMGAGVQVTEGYLLVPHGFWFFGADPNQIGGVVAYKTPDTEAPAS